MIKWYFSQIC